MLRPLHGGKLRPEPKGVPPRRLELLLSCFSDSFLVPMNRLVVAYCICLQLDLLLLDLQKLLEPCQLPCLLLAQGLQPPKGTAERNDPTLFRVQLRRL